MPEWFRQILRRALWKRLHLRGSARSPRAPAECPALPVCCKSRDSGAISQRNLRTLSPVSETAENHCRTVPLPPRLHAGYLRRNGQHAKWHGRNRQSAISEVPAGTLSRPLLADDFFRIVQPPDSSPPEWKRSHLLNLHGCPWYL